MIESIAAETASPGAPRRPIANANPRESRPSRRGSDANYFLYYTYVIINL